MSPEEMIKMRKEWDDYRINYAKTHPEQYESSRKLNEWIKEQQVQGKIINPSIRNWLDGEITAARIALAIGMILTALIKGQIVIWAIMYIAYRGRIKKVKKEAFEADRGHNI